MDYILISAIILLAIVWAISIVIDRKDKSISAKFDNKLRFRMIEDDLNKLKRRVNHITEDHIPELDERVEHLSKVNLLLLDHLSLEHHIQLQKDVLVKKTKDTSNK